MPIVNLTIRNNIYQIACDDGEERYLEQMAASINKRINRLASTLGKGNDSLLLVMVALMMEDEINELKKQPSSPPASQADDTGIDADTAVAHAIDAIAEYVETIAKNLERH